MGLINQSYMKNFKFIIVTFLLLASVITIDASVDHLCINEVMQSNIDYLMVDNDFPDSWVELYNPTEQEINIKWWRIGLEADISSAFILRADTIVPPKGYLLIYCDKEGKGLHTDFRLDSGKGEIHLFNAAHKEVDMLSMKKMPGSNIAYGRKNDGEDKWQYEVTPTAGYANKSVGAKDILPDPIFSIGGGVMNAPITVTITMPKGDYPKDTKLYVTTDGSEPTRDSPTHESFTFNISATTILRAKLISSNALIPRSVTHSYIYHPRATKLPIISIVTDDEFFYDKKLGIFSKDTLIGNVEPNYALDYRRPINTEYFDMRNSGAEVFNQVGETAVSGMNSRKFAQKSLKIYANKRFGTKRYEGDFWGDKNNITKVKSFILRNGGSRCLTNRISDAFVQKLFGTHVNELDWQAYQPVIVYINGKYKGEYGMRERSDEDFVEANYDGLEDIYCATANTYVSTYDRQQCSFEDLYNAYTNEKTTYLELSDLIDVDNFMNALIAEMYSLNADYPHNNISMWKPQSEGGKWKWILKDLDTYSINTLTFNMFNYMFISGDHNSKEYQIATQPEQRIETHRLYQKMISFPEFQSVFIDRYSTYLGDFLKPSVAMNLVNKMEEEFQEEIAPTFEANDNMSEFSAHIKGINTMLEYCQKLPNIIYHQMAEYFNLGEVIPMTVIAHEQNVRVNNVRLTEGDFDGAYFSERKLNLNSGSNTWCWKMTITHNDGSSNSYIFDQDNIDVLLSDYYNDKEGSISVAFETIPMEMKYDLVISAARWATICLPFSFDAPDGVNIYSADGIADNGTTIFLSSVTKTEANKPYIVNGSANVYPITGYTDAIDANLTNGLLKGTYQTIYVPAGAYVLQNKDSGVGFYRVAENNSIELKSYRAYLEIPIIQSHSKDCLMLDETTGIDSTNTDVFNTHTFFSANGIQTRTLRKGLNIVKSTNGETKKVIVR